MKVLKLIPWIPADTSEERPVPSTNRNRKGCTSEVMIRRRSREKRISSRRHTTRIARSSPATLRVGTRTPATSWAGGAAGVGAVSVAAIRSSSSRVKLAVGV
jgi:hypothetical protein